MTKKEILKLKDTGHSQDAIYEQAAGSMSLYGVAFFGHKGKKGDRQRLARVWQRILNVFTNH